MKCLATKSVSLPTYDVFPGLNPDLYEFTVDWLNVRLDCDNLETLILRLINYLPELDISDFQPRESGGVCFYKEGIHIPKIGYSSFVLAFNRDFDGNIINKPEGTAARGELHGVLLSISGDGCRFINSLHDNAFCDLLEAISIYNPHCSRIDMACDIFDKDNMIVPMIHTFSETAYKRDEAIVDFNCGLVRKAGWVTLNLVYDDIVNDFTRNVTIGGRNSSKGTLQLYNKRVEVASRFNTSDEVKNAILDSVPNSDYWWRLEYRCKSFAQKVYNNLVESKNIYSAFFQACENFGTFVSPVYDSDHITLAEDVVEWVIFLDFVRQLSGNDIHLVQLVSQKYYPDSLHKNEKFITEQVAGSVAVSLIRAALDEEYRKRLFRRSFQKLFSSNRYSKLIDELRQTYGLKLEEFVDLAFEQSNIDIA